MIQVTKELQELIDEHKAEREKEMDAVHRQREIRQRIAEMTCPHKVGDVIEITGYSYSGKMGRVERIVSPRWESLGWRVVVSVLTKDGKPGKNTADVEDIIW